MKFKISKSQWEEMGKKAGWMNKTANSPILFIELELLAKQLFPTADEMELENIINGILKETPASHEEAVQMLKDYASSHSSVK